MSPVFRDIYNSFPVQLVMLHIKKQHILLVFWLILFGIIMGGIGKKLGIPYLFLDPEYMGKVSFWGFFIVGFTYGGFLMTWNITTYILNSFRFPFLATLERPFTKYCLNNFIIPFFFLILYLGVVINFQLNNEYNEGRVWLYILGFLFGVVLFILASILYFRYTTANVFKMFGIKNQDLDEKRRDMEIRQDTDKKSSIDDKAWKVDVYLNSPFSIRLVRPVNHYDLTLLLAVFRRHHINALVIEIFALLALVVLGFLIDYPIFRIPAAASVFLLFSILIMLTGAFSFWLRGWRTTAFIALIILLNFFIKKDWFNVPNRAYGLEYSGNMAAYNPQKLQELSNEVNIKEDVDSFTRILESWKAKNTALYPGEQKPKIIFINTSGGGLRAAVWTMKVLQFADSVMGGRLMNNTFLITGASGGIVGASYFRELTLRKKTGQQVNPYDIQYLDRISQDLLNPVAFTLAVTDIFFPWQKFTSGKKSYPKDRGYMFEKQLNENTKNVFIKTIGDYRIPERSMAIPLVIMTPTIINDGRKLLISPHKVSFLSKATSDYTFFSNPEIDAVDFQRLFVNQDADSLFYSTALRMNSTFPYVMPNVHMPTKPRSEVMDAGLRDNFGIETSTRFIHVFKKWIMENTSGVIYIQIRDSEKQNFKLDKGETTSLYDKLFKPIGNFYANWNEFQDYSQDNLINYTTTILDGKMEVIRFQYIPETAEKQASLSWHLTKSEKYNILQAIHNKSNQDALQHLQLLLTDSSAYRSLPK